MSDLATAGGFILGVGAGVLAVTAHQSREPVLYLAAAVLFILMFAVML